MDKHSAKLYLTLENLKQVSHFLKTYLRILKFFSYNIINNSNIYTDAIYSLIKVKVS